jgi:hypothetical protein
LASPMVMAVGEDMTAGWVSVRNDEMG